MLKEFAIIVAGGVGKRMKAHLPKQFLELKGTPILMMSIRVFYEYSSDIQIIVVLPETEIPFWFKLCEEKKFKIPHRVVSGGSSRQESVLNGLNVIDDIEGIVAVHDGVRPFVSKEIIKESFIFAEKMGNAIATVALKDSLRFIGNGKNTAVNRADFQIVQTPQTFKLSQIKQAYKICEGEFTDDASLVENAGFSIYSINGSYENIKITTEDDLAFAEVIMNRNNR